MEAAGALPVSRGSEDAEHLPIQVLETQADKWTKRISMLQGISLKKRIRERKKEKKKERKTRGEQASVSEAHYFIFKRDFYTLTCT